MMNSIVAGSNWKPKVDNEIPILLTTEEEPTAFVKIDFGQRFWVSHLGILTKSNQSKKLPHDLDWMDL